MKYVMIPAAGGEMKVSRLVLGTDGIEPRWTDDEFFSQTDRYLAHGGNCIDTARVYCGGKSEEKIGRWFARNGKRHDVILSTKGCHPPNDNMPQSRLSRQDMDDDLGLSLKALQTDYIDIYWLHRDDPAIPVEGIIENLNDFVRAGKIRALGASNWTGERLTQANDYAQKHGLAGFVTSQIQWSLAETDLTVYNDYGVIVMNKNELAWYEKTGMPVFAFSAQAKGFFTQLANGGPEALKPKASRRFYRPANVERLGRLQALAEKYGVSLSAASLAYISCNRLPALAIMGYSTEHQFLEDLEACSLEITPEEADALV